MKLAVTNERLDKTGFKSSIPKFSTLGVDGVQAGVSLVSVYSAHYCSVVNDRLRTAYHGRRTVFVFRADRSSLACWMARAKQKYITSVHPFVGAKIVPDKRVKLAALEIKGIWREIFSVRTPGTCQVYSFDQERLRKRDGGVEVVSVDGVVLTFEVIKKTQDNFLSAASVCWADFAAINFELVQVSALRVTETPKLESALDRFERHLLLARQSSLELYHAFIDRVRRW